MSTLCPTCHSQIGTASTTAAGRIQGVEGTDDNLNPIPRWTDDPIITKKGLSGATYAGNADRGRFVQIEELQTARQQQEEDAGLTVEQKTTFSTISTDKHISRRHIVELRESTEKVLNVLGLDLEEYFSLDDDGNPVVQNPNLLVRGASNPQNEWIDVNRGEAYIDRTGVAKTTVTLPNNSIVDSPTLPRRTHIRAVHIEDLRHPLSVGAAILMNEIVHNESNDNIFFGPQTSLFLDKSQGTSKVYHGRKAGGATVLKVEACKT